MDIRGEGERSQPDRHPVRLGQRLVDRAHAGDQRQRSERLVIHGHQPGMGIGHDGGRVKIAGIADGITPGHDTRPPGPRIRHHGRDHIALVARA